MSQNKLSLEKSAYLLQHAENPIHWWNYGPQALESAKQLGRPIFLSIGYSTCHWCHVMAHESFEDQQTAEFLNKNFVCIKVDREERPDVDHLYQTVAAASQGRGGWPLSVFLTPEQAPIFVGTYFPKQGRDGMPGFMDVLKHINDLYKEKNADLNQQGQGLLNEIRKPASLEKTIEFQGHFPAPAAIMNALKNYADEQNGGWGQAPKFPHFAFMQWGAEQILEGMIPQDLGQHLVDSFEKMLMGGMYDHLRGGIHRYSTDAQWLVPHFEKMLYDQAGLLSCLARFTQFYPSPLFFDAIMQTLEYLESEMISEHGYFHAAQDADSEGQEGLYFTFTKEEFIQTLKNAEEELGPYQAEWEKWFRVTDKGNFEQGLNVISLDPAQKQNFYSQEGWEKVRQIRHILLQERRMRIPPATDSKGIASWNFMLLTSLCDVVQYCPIPSIAQQAVNLVNKVVEGIPATFIHIQDGERHTLRHVTTNQTPLYFEDYVTFAECQFRLYEVTGNDVFQNNATETVEFIAREFLQDGQAFTLPCNTQQTTQLHVAINDQAFKSTLATLSLMCARWSLVSPTLSPEKIFGNEWKNHIQLALSNPIAHGEALRTFTYPLDIFRRLEVPRSWINDHRFQELRGHFLSRFVLTYNDSQEDWQVCNRTACELPGKGLDKFIELFKTQEADGSEE